MSWTLLAAVVLTLVAVAVAWLLRKPGVIVLGTQMAEARRRDEEVRRGQSPLPQRSYDARESSLVRPREVPLDGEIGAVVQRFAAGDDTARRTMRQAISTDEFYQLMLYAQRQAVFAMRDGKCEGLVNGFTAAAMIDVERIDYRDASSLSGPLHYAAQKCGLDSRTLFADAAAISTPEMREVFENFLAMPESDQTLKASLLHDVGTGFVGRMIAKYHPTRDLATATVKIYDLLDADRYPGSSVSIADDFSDHWFPAAGNAYRHIRAGAMLHGKRDDAKADETQTLMVYLAETATPADAEALRAALRVPEGGARLGIARGNLFVSVIGAAMMAGHRTVETDQSLARFAGPLAKILEETR
jgi:hypothetical protein